MTDTTLTDHIDDVIENGESRSHGGDSIKSPSIDKIDAIDQRRKRTTAAVNTVNPIFRGFNLNGMAG